MRHGQLLLNLAPRLDARLSDFAGPSWAAIISAINHLLAGDSERCLVYGAANTGKTHLLAAACEALSQQNEPTLLVSLPELMRTCLPESLQNLENHTLIALDDLEAITGLPEWQEALFHLLNRAQEHHTRIIMTAGVPPGQLGFTLPDLVSRLKQAACFQTPTGEDVSDREAVLRAALGRRELMLDPDIVRYLLLKGPRYIGLLLKHLNYLEQESLQQRKRLTLNFVKQLTETKQGRDRLSQP